MRCLQKRIKRDVVPHSFACQEDRKRTYPSAEEMTVVKKNKATYHSRCFM